ncbi:hypothetical protein PUNSTDRAFT_60770 [Punctularia strigosozonata HHB-11173 SS5]|uniref:uncharacterized protein n=1 Tax=Punctularia strigosozonata (strain HHB-11173) TaxID=741275 RepID=UPI00044182E6|nr:uncharacterized protein PUNSTDRAFT_60770 [Punctularia strigosozonata HHB-11173 SS5]EIN12737.1 hypothetical protein PUNSTDRAFT_60770 [Punctularia strigosozonata HHB-11173 SS5]
MASTIVTGSETLRKRLPFRFKTDDQDEDPILDEQEQEEVINSIQTENSRRNDQYTLMYQLTLGLSGFLHLVYLFSPNTDSPLAPFLSSDPSRTQWSKPSIAVFVLFQVTLHAGFGLLFLTRHEEEWLTERGVIPLPMSLSYRRLLICSAIIPSLSFLAGRDWATVIWWCTAGVMGMFGQTLRKWMSQGDQKIQRLEELRYVAPGA